MDQWLFIITEFHKNKKLSFGFLFLSLTLTLAGLITWCTTWNVSHFPELLSENSWRWKLKEHSYNRRKDIYLFNCTNLSSRSTNPICTRVGPFKFKEFWRLKNITWSKDGVLYNRVKDWNFIEEESVDLDTDITNVYVGDLDLWGRPPIDPPFLKLLIAHSYLTGENLFYSTMSAGEWLHQGFTRFFEKNQTVDGLWGRSTFDRVEFWHDVQNGDSLNFSPPKSYFDDTDEYKEIKPTMCTELSLKPQGRKRSDKYKMEIMTYGVENPIQYVKKITKFEENCPIIAAPLQIAMPPTERFGALSETYAHVDVVTGLVLQSNYSYELLIDFKVRDELLNFTIHSELMLHVDYTELDEDAVKLLAYHHNGSWHHEITIRNVLLSIGCTLIFLFLLSLVIIQYSNLHAHLHRLISHAEDGDN